LPGHACRHRLPLRRRDQTEKKVIYERNGVDEYWIVDGQRKTVTVFRFGDTGYDAGKAFRSGAIRSRVLPRLRLSIAKLFAL